MELIGPVDSTQRFLMFLNMETFLQTLEGQTYKPSVKGKDISLK